MKNAKFIKINLRRQSNEMKARQAANPSRPPFNLTDLSLEKITSIKKKSEITKKILKAHGLDGLMHFYFAIRTKAIASLATELKAIQLEYGIKLDLNDAWTKTNKISIPDDLTQTQLMGAYNEVKRVNDSIDPQSDYMIQAYLEVSHAIQKEGNPEKKKQLISAQHQFIEHAPLAHDIFGPLMQELLSRIKHGH